MGAPTNARQYLSPRIAVALLLALATFRTAEATCFLRQKVLYPGDFLTSPQVSVEQGNGVCRLGLNLPQCSSEFADCCGGAAQYCRSVGENDICMACLNTLELPRVDVCQEYKDAVDCLVLADGANNCFAEPRLGDLRQDFDEIFFDGGPYCPQGACNINNAIACVDTLLQGKPGPFCPDLGGVRSCFTDQGCDPNPFLNAPANQRPNRFGPCGPPPIPPECNVLSVFRGPLNLTSFEGWNNGDCDIELNTADCLFDGGECCVNPGDLCIDPAGGPLFSAPSENCFNNCIAPFRFDGGFCQWFANVLPCLTTNVCAPLNAEFAEIIDFGTTVATPACLEPLCDTDAAYACVSQVLERTIDAANCDQEKTNAQECFTNNGCSNTVADDFVTLIPEFNSCSGSIPPTCTQLSIFPDKVGPFAGWQDGRCSIELNTADCNFDDGECCLASTDVCVDSGNGFFNPLAQACMNCITGQAPFSDGFCPWFNAVGPCLTSNGCGGGAIDGRFDEVVDVFQNVAANGCAECDLEAAYLCLDTVLLVPVNIVNCNTLFTQAQQCFDSEGCSIATRDAALSFFPEFNICSGGNTGLDLLQCGLRSIKLPFTDPLLRPERLGDGFCDPEYNVPECEFDAGDCCLFPGGVCIENGGNGNFAQASACMACLDQVPFDPDRPETICAFVGGSVNCILSNNCPPLHPLFGDLLNEVQIFGDLCSDLNCDQGQAVVCLDALKGNSTNGTSTSNTTSSGLDCSAISEVTECLDAAGCSKDLVLDSIGVGNESKSIVEDCFGCVPSLGVEIEVIGERKCGIITIQAKLNISDSCVSAINGIFDSPDFSQFFRYSWNIDIVPIGRRLQGPGAPFIPFPFFSNQNRVILPGAALPPDNLNIDVTVEATVFPDIKGSAILEFDPVVLVSEPIIPKTSEVGSLTLYAGLANAAAFYEINAFSSCNPNIVGCELCTRTEGFLGFLDPLLSENLIKEITGFEGPLLPSYDFQWTVDCQNAPCSLSPQVGYRFSIDQALLNPANSPYVITLEILEDGGVTTYKAAPITLNVLDGSGIPPGCEIPIVNILTPQAQLALDIFTQEQNLAINEEVPEIVLFAELTRQDGSPIDDPVLEGFILEWYEGPLLVQIGEALVVEDDFDGRTFTLVAVNPCTGGNDPFKELVFRSNKPPENGTLTVTPDQGDIRTLFRLSTSGWQDPESNLPLSFIYLVQEVVITPPLGPVVQQFLFGLGSVQVKVLAQDSLGALSKPAEFSVTMQALETTNIEDNYFEDLTGRGTGETELLAAVLGVADLLNTDTQNANSAKSRLLRKKCLEVVRSAGAALRAQNDSTVENLVVQADAIGRVCENPEELASEDFGEIADFFKDLLAQVKDTDLATQTTVDPVFRDVLRGAALLLDALVKSGLARRLQGAPTGTTCTDVQNMRDVVTELGLIRSKDDFPGSFVRNIDAPAVRVVAANTRSNQVAGNYTVGNVTIILPANLSSDSSTVTTLLSQYDFNVRICDDADTDFLATVAGEDECEELNTNVPINFNGPLKPVDSVVSLEFRNTLGAGGGLAFEPTDLDSPIVLNIPLGNLGDEDDGLCSNFTKLSCGFYSQSANGFRTDGCSVTGVDYAQGTLECTCNHASDYAAWLAFEEDVRNVFSKPLTLVTLFGVLLSAGILGVVFATYFICLLLGHRRDRRTAKVLQKEAVGIMVLNNFLLRQRQRQFFENLRVAVERGKGESGEAPVREQVEEEEGSPGLCARMCLALRYEHSLLGLVRYDPHYSSVQRVSVFIAVVMGNLFVAALAFELKDSEIDDLSPGFVVVVVLISSLMVAIPVRLVIKMLFRITEFQKGSESERVAQLYRISKQAEESFEDVVANRNDLALIYAYKELYIAQEHVKAAETAAGRAHKRGCCCCGGRADTSRAMSQPQGTPVVEDEEADFTESLSNLNQEDKRAPEEELALARQELVAAQRRLKETTQRAKEDWQRSNKKDAIKRVKLVTKQKSTFMKAIALVADEAAPLAKPRRGLCPHFLVYVSWVVLLGLYGLSVFYVVRFVLTRADRAALPSVNRTEEELIGVWLTTSAIGILIGYCLAEPLIAIIRYAVLPYCVLKCGNNTVEEEEEVDVVDEDEAAFNESLKQLDGDEEKGDAGGKQQGARGQYFLEFVSDLIETIY